MVALSTSRLSSKGQVVIPEEIRTRLGLKHGCRFLVVANRGVVMLKVIDAPSPEEFDALVASARREARGAGLKKADVAKAIKRVRSGKARKARGGD
jgi:AbrB family looped-hinge helix DNA binding protein